MPTPLQPDLRPRDPVRTRLLVALGLLLAIVLVGWLGSARTPPTRLLAPGASEDYVRTVDRLMVDARRRVWVMLFVVRMDDGPVQGLLDGLAAAAKRGVEVVVVLDRPRSDANADEASRNRDAGRWLDQHGVRVVWDEAGRTTHAKIVLADDTVVIGSHNWTRSALLLNREVSSITGSPEVVREVEQVFATVPGFAVAGTGSVDR